MNADGVICIRRALISVSDKAGLAFLSDMLTKMKVDILSTGGTRTFLEHHNVQTTAISDYTNYPEIMAGRVKTLHPKIYGGILARRDTDKQVMAEYDINAIDLVVVNLYPFRETIARTDCDLPMAIENIDIGGPAMIRAAAKNHKYVVVVVDPADYQKIAEEMQEIGGISKKTRQMLAVKAFMHTAEYDTAIHTYLTGQAVSKADNEFLSGAKNQSGHHNTTFFSDKLDISFYKQADLRYGENPHQQAAFYTEQAPPAATLATAKQHQGKALSYNNIADADAALSCVKSFTATACVIVKHANPCGVALGNTPQEAYQRAFAADPVSAFGGIIAFNCVLNRETAETIINQQFAEVIIARGIEVEAATVFATKKNLRLLTFGQETDEAGPVLTYKRVSGGLLVQTSDEVLTDTHKTEVVTHRKPTDAEMADLMFAWHVVKFVKSNAIVYAKENQTTGIGAGQMSRVYSAKIAAMKAEEQNFSVEGAVMASDAFFPFRDSVDIAAKMGITAMIQPGGSIRDQEITEAANEHGMAMIFTGIRHFLH